MSLKYDVEIVEHTPWSGKDVVSNVKIALARSEQLYAKLLQSMTVPEEREAAVRHRVLQEQPKMAKFSTDHPRLFGLSTSEAVVKDPERKKLLFVLLFIHDKVARGEIKKQDAHDQFVKLSMQVNSKK